MGCVSSKQTEIQPNNTDLSTKLKTKSTSNKSSSIHNKAPPLIYNIDDIVEIFDLKTASWILCIIRDIRGSYIEVIEYQNPDNNNNNQINNNSTFSLKLHLTWDKYRIRLKPNNSAPKMNKSVNNNNNNNNLSSYSQYLRSFEWKITCKYPLCLSKSAVCALRVGDYIDHRDSVGHFVLAKLISRKVNLKQNQIKIHYIGWNNKWDRWFNLDLNNNICNKFYSAGSISERAGHRLKYLRIGDYIDFCYLNNWYYAQIKSSDKISAQIRVIWRNNNNKQKTYWSHIDNENEIQEFGKKCGMNKIKINEIITANKIYKINQIILINDNTTGICNTNSVWIKSKIIDIKYNWIKIKYCDNNYKWKNNKIFHIIHNKNNIKLFSNNNENSVKQCVNNDYSYKILYKDYIVSNKIDSFSNNSHSNLHSVTSSNSVSICSDNNCRTVKDDQKDLDVIGDIFDERNSNEEVVDAVAVAVDCDPVDCIINELQCDTGNNNNVNISSDLMYGDAQLIELNALSVEYNNISSSFNSTTCSSYQSYDYSIVSIYSIRNDELLESYNYRKYQILKSLNNNSSLLNEQMLWHGTRSDIIPKIMNQGFLRQFARYAKFGRGTYFARDALYSSQTRYSIPDNDNIQFVLYCYVICGESCLGDSNMNVPNIKISNNNEKYPKNKLYETTVNNLEYPAIYVTYTDNQALPAYLICFKSK